MASDTSDKAPDAAYDEVSEGGALPPVDFTTFVLSLATSALVSLGEVKGDSPDDKVDLPLARQTIDTISMLQDKTKGNLSGEEERLVNQVLFDLRMKFVEAAQRHKK
ncbi:MAG: DUF1844 domain-containing protein [Polyangiales bacterium]